MSGPGPSGARAVHWAAALHSPVAMEALALVADRVAAADLPEAAVAGLADICVGTGTGVVTRKD